MIQVFRALDWLSSKLWLKNPNFGKNKKLHERYDLPVRGNFG